MSFLRGSVLGNHQQRGRGSEKKKKLGKNSSNEAYYNSRHDLVAGRSLKWKVVSLHQATEWRMQRVGGNAISWNVGLNKRILGSNFLFC